MRPFIALLKNDIKLFMKDWKAVALLLVMPFLFICLFVYALSPYLNKSSFIEPFTVALVDKENSVQTRILTRQLDDIELFKKVLRVDEKKARDMLDHNEIAAMIIIPEGLSRSVAVGENKPVTVVGNKSMPLQSFVAKNIALSAANLVSAGQSAINTIAYYDRKAGLRGKDLEKDVNDSTMEVLVDTLSRNEIFTEYDAEEKLDITPMEYYTAALIVIFLMFAGMPGMKMLVTERSLNLTRRLMASPVKLWQIILSKFFVSLLLSAIQFLIIVVFTSFVFKNYWGAPVKSILLLFGGIVTAVSAWSVFVSAIARTPASADVIGNLGILLMAVVGGSIYPLTSMPVFVRNLSNLTINKWAMQGFMEIFSGNDVLNVFNYVYPLIIIGLVMMVASTVILKLYRR